MGNEYKLGFWNYYTIIVGIWLIGKIILTIKLKNFELNNFIFGFLAFAFIKGISEWTSDFK